MEPPLTRVRWTRTCRLIPTRYPSVGLFDRVASPDDLDSVLELEGWTYAARTVDTAVAESVHHRTNELAEIGLFETRMQLRLYHADFSAPFHDVRGRAAAGVYDPGSYARAQALARRLFDAGSNGIVYRSVRDEDGECLACFRPALVLNVRVAAHYEYRWEGTRTPRIIRLQAGTATAAPYMDS